MIQRNFNKQNIKFFKFFDQKNLGSLPRIFLCSMLVVFFFYSMPLIIEFSDQENNEFQNKSKAILAYTLNNEGNNLSKDNEVLNENDLLIDIFSLNDLETDTVRLNASTIKQLFEDTDYKLKDVREKKISKTSSSYFTSS